MSGWGEFFCAALTFLFSHMLPAQPNLRPRLIALLGRRLYFAVYTIISIATLSWLIVAAGRTPVVILWVWSPERIWIANGIMAVAIFFALGGIGIANPFSLGGLKSKSFDPARPGILAVTRHPLLWAIALWSIAHVIANGDLAHVLLFGGAFAMAIVAAPVFEARSRRSLGVNFRELSQDLDVFPFVALLAGRARWRSIIDWRLAAAPAIWTVVVFLHVRLLGVSPLPPH